MLKKNVLILGASHKNSIGTLFGALLRKDGYHVVLSSRHQSPTCDVTDPKQIIKIVQATKPDVILYCVGTFIPPNILGNVTHWKKIEEHLLSRTLGVLILLNALINLTVAPKIIFITGKSSSADPSFAAYITANAALVGLTRFIRTHFPQINLHVISYPAIHGTYMLEKYKEYTKNSCPAISINNAYRRLKKCL